MRLLIEGLALRPPAPSAAHVHRVVTGVAKDHGWPMPSYATVYAIVRGIDPAMRTLALQTALTLRQAIWRKSEPGWHVCGIPGTFYTDHGSDFTSQHMEQVAADLKIRLVFSRELGQEIRDRSTVVDRLLAVHQPAPDPPSPPAADPSATTPQLKRYREE